MKKDAKNIKKPKQNSANEEIEYNKSELTKTERELADQLERVVIIDDNPKAQKKLAKRQIKEAKVKAKVAKSLTKQAKHKKTARVVGKETDSDQQLLTQKTAKKALFDRKGLKEKKVKEPKNYELAFKEFPVKMVKEVSKIRWSSKQNLLIKFIQVILFILVFAILFYLVDLAFQELFTLMRII